MEEGLKNEVMLDDRGSFRPVEQNFQFSYLYKLVLIPFLKIKSDIWTDKMETTSENNCSFQYCFIK